jgi:hypothetical protein
MTAEDIKEKVRILGRELGECIESSEKELPRVESLAIGMTALMDALTCYSEWEKDLEIDTVLRAYFKKD